MRAPEKPVGVGGVSRVELWIVPADARGAWTSEIPAHGGRWNFRVKQNYQVMDIDVAAQGRDLLVRNSRLRGEEIKIIVTGIVNGRAWHHYFVGTLKDDRISRRGDRFGRQQQEEFPLDGNAERGSARSSCCRCPTASSSIAGMVIGVGIFKRRRPRRRQRRRAARSSSLAWVARRRRLRCAARWSTPSSPRAIRRPAASTPSCARGLGDGVAFVFAWSRMTVIQTGAIAAVAFVFGDYASEIVSPRARTARDLGGDRRGRCSPRSTSPARCNPRACRR